jgi:cytochrome c oxidase subunit 3
LSDSAIPATPDSAIPAGVHDHHPALQHHFDTLEQQQHAAAFGMWVFLVTEVLFFAGMFMVYILYRTWYPDMFAAASHTLDLTLGTVNTAVLIGSSLTMAMAVYSAQTSAPPRRQVFWLLATMFLGAIFLGIKVVEYHDKFVHHHVPGPNFSFDPPYGATAQLYFSLYFGMTGLHASHMVVGIGIMAVVAWMAWRRKFDSEWYTPVEITGLYWHFVDIVWIFLFPLLYLAGGR